MLLDPDNLAHRYHGKSVSLCEAVDRFAILMGGENLSVSRRGLVNNHAGAHASQDKVLDQGPAFFQ
jgi:hypothetical protein